MSRHELHSAHALKCALCLGPGKVPGSCTLICVPYVAMQEPLRRLSLQVHAGLIDFGQSKQLSDEQRLAFARLVLAMSAAEGADLLDVAKAMSVPQQMAVAQGLEAIGIRYRLQQHSDKLLAQCLHGPSVRLFGSPCQNAAAVSGCSRFMFSSA